MEQYEQAIECYTEILKVEESDIAYGNRGLSKWELGRLEDALKDFRSAIALNPGNVPALRGAGSILIELARHEEAMQYLLVAVALAPTDSIVHRRLGSSYYRKGEWEKALKSFQYALSLDSQDEFSQNGIDAVLKKLAE